MYGPEHDAWLASLKAGDRVAVAYGFRCETFEPARVTRRTPTGRITVEVWGRTEQFDKRGRRRLSRWDSQYLQPWTQEVEGVIERERLLSRIDRAKWKALDIASLRAVVAVLDADKEPTP